MSPSAPRELMLLVERVVRPLPASLKLKKRMRDELLQHLSSIHTEELARDGDASAALVRTRQRFGDLDELSRELRTSVPSSDQWLRGLEWCVMQRVDESIPAFVLRLGVLQAALASVIFLLAPARLAVGVMLMMALGFGGYLLFSFVWGDEWEHRRRWFRLCGASLGAVGCFPLGLLIMLFVSGSDWNELSRFCSSTSLIGLAILGTILGPIVGVLHTRDMTYLREWAKLELGTEP